MRFSFFNNPTAMKSALFLFDLDGTLVDTAPDLGGAVNDMRVVRGLDPLPLELLRAPAGHGSPELLKVAFGMDSSHPAFAEMRAEFLSRYAERCTESSILFPGVLELLTALKAQGVTCGVVTNKPHPLALRVVDALGIAPYLTLTLGTGAPGTALKPAPDSLLTALQTLQIPPERALYAGDSSSDALASAAANLAFAWVSWGCQKDAPTAPAPRFVARRTEDLLIWAQKTLAAR